MDSTMQKSWWVYLLQGIATVLFGLAALVWPVVALLSLFVLFAVFAVIVGIFRVVASLLNRQESGWWLVLLSGIASIVAGIVAFAWPGLTALVLLYVIAAQALLFGVTALWQTVRNWSEAQEKWMLLLSGISAIIFGILAFFWPGATALTIAWVIGIYAVIFGVSEIVSSFIIRRATAQS